jgi:hypothetical protein
MLSLRQEGVSSLNGTGVERELGKEAAGRVVFLLAPGASGFRSRKGVEFSHTISQHPGTSIGRDHTQVLAEILAEVIPETCGGIRAVARLTKE